MIPRLLRSLPLVLGGLLLTNIPLCAQASPASAILLDPFPVVGTRLPEGGLADSPAVVVWDRDYITRTGTTQLTELLNFLPQTYGGAASGHATVPNGSPSYGTALALYNFSGSSPALRQTGVSSVGLRGLGAGGTLVLIDGQRLPLATQEDTANPTGAGFYDLSTIPLGMVERVEILSQGASAVHGSDAVGGVVNIILRRDYRGSELVAGIRATQDGGGFERHATLSTGLVQGPLSLFVAATVWDRNPLKASQRPFSATQDRSDQGRRNFELGVANPGVVGTTNFSFLPGVTDPNGNPARFALAPLGTDGLGLSTSDFTGASGFFAAGMRHLNTADSKDLIGGAELLGLRASATYTFSPRIEGFLNLNYSDRRSTTSNEPPTTLGGGFGGTRSYLPADSPYNPFGTTLAITMAHTEAPLRPQIVDTTLQTLTAGLRGAWAENWQWRSSFDFSREDFDSRTSELRQDRFVAALADGSFNPFADPALGPANAHLYATLMSDARITGDSQVTAWEIDARGPAWSLPAGDAWLAFGAETRRAERQRDSTDPLFGQDASTRSSRSNSAAFAELHLPLLEQFSARVAARYERSDAFDQTSPHLSFVWQPLPVIAIHGSVASGFRAPSLTEMEDPQRSRIDDINDPLLNGLNYDVTILEGGNTEVEAESSRSYQLGLSLTPPPVPGLRLRALLNETYYTDKLNALGQQTLVDFADQFPGRVTRDATGRITTVDATTINFGKIYLRSLDLSLSYQHGEPDTGQWTVQIDAARQLEYRTEERPDRVGDIILDGADTGSPPAWRGLASVHWMRGDWDATAFVHYADGYDTNGSGPFFDRSTAAPSWTSLDLRVGYRFREGLWRGVARDLELRVGISNVTDEAPPFANTVWGYNQGLHSPLGRTYDVSIRLPF